MMMTSRMYLSSALRGDQAKSEWKCLGQTLMLQPIRPS